MALAQNNVILGMLYATVAAAVAGGLVRVISCIVSAFTSVASAKLRRVAQRIGLFETYEFGPGAHVVGAAKALVNAGFSSGFRISAHECTRDGANVMPDGYVITDHNA